MSDASSSGFAQFVPGFDFLQNLTKSTAQAMPQLPNMGSWIAPTLSVEELDKRIAELKAVHFWLDQNTKALAATVQALEVQKMTLATLKSMNLNLAEVAKAFTPKAADSVAPIPPQASATPTAPVTEAAGHAVGQGPKVEERAKPAAGTAAAGLADPMQLWSALTQQFQAIAASAMAEVGKTTAKAASKNPIKGATQPAAKATASTPKAPAQKTPVKRAATKTAAKKAAATADAPTRGLRRR